MEGGNYWPLIEQLVKASSYQDILILQLGLLVTSCALWPIEVKQDGAHNMSFRVQLQNYIALPQGAYHTTNTSIVTFRASRSIAGLMHRIKTLYLDFI